MTAIIAGATTHEKSDWYTIDWQKANLEVSRLQARIVKATQEGRWGYETVALQKNDHTWYIFKKEFSDFIIGVFSRWLRS